jgi:hypothetical protein
MSTLFSSKKDPTQTPVIEQDEIDTYNSNNYPFKLGPNEFFREWNLSDAKRVMNT